MCVSTIVLLAYVAGVIAVSCAKAEIRSGSIRASLYGHPDFFRDSQDGSLRPLRGFRSYYSTRFGEVDEVNGSLALDGAFEFYDDPARFPSGATPNLRTRYSLAVRSVVFTFGRDAGEPLTEEETSRVASFLYSSSGGRASARFSPDVERVEVPDVFCSLSAENAYHVTDYVDESFRDGNYTNEDGIEYGSEDVAFVAFLPAACAPSGEIADVGGVAELGGSSIVVYRGRGGGGASSSSRASLVARLLGVVLGASPSPDDATSPMGPPGRHLAQLDSLDYSIQHKFGFGWVDVSSLVLDREDDGKPFRLAPADFGGLASQTSDGRRKFGLVYRLNESFPSTTTVWVESRLALNYSLVLTSRIYRADASKPEWVSRLLATTSPRVDALAFGGWEIRTTGHGTVSSRKSGPTASPTPQPTRDPTTSSPTTRPSRSPTKRPSRSPSHHPTHSPTRLFSFTRKPTKQPTERPTFSPTSPTSPPTKTPTILRGPCNFAATVRCMGLVSKQTCSASKECAWCMNSLCVHVDCVSTVATTATATCEYVNV